MADFNQVIQWLKEGKKVKRPCWKEGSYWIIGIDSKICWKDGETAHIHLNQIEATDWEMYCEKHKSLSDKKLKAFKMIGTYNHEVNYKEEDVKEKIQNAQRRLMKEMNLTFSNGQIINKIFKEEFGDKIMGVN